MIALRSIMTAAAIVALGVAAQAAPAGPPELALSHTQEREIYFDVNGQGRATIAPPGFVARVGGVLPPSIGLMPLPARAVRHEPAVKGYGYAIVYYYAMATNEVLLVAPASRRIVAVVTP